jgi:hypothetical protein
MKQMEALFDELTAEDGDFQLALSWEVKHILTPAGLSEHINPAKDCFEYDRFRFWWYHAENFKHPDTPVVVAEWTSNHREDDWDTNEQEIDATAQDIADFIKSVEDGYEPDSGLPDRLEEIG